MGYRRNLKLCPDFETLVVKGCFEACGKIYAVCPRASFVGHGYTCHIVQDTHFKKHASLVTNINQIKCTVKVCSPKTVNSFCTSGALGIECRKWPF